MKRLSLAFIAAACIAVPANAQTTPLPTPPPAPPLPNATVTPVVPIARPSAAAHAKATPAPPKDVDENRAGISGVWEVAIQNDHGVVYTHFKLSQRGSTLTGQYLDADGKRFPLAGSVDGKNVRVVVSLPNGGALIFNGSQDGGTDMVGTLDTAKDLVGFTAAYRPKYKWIDNLTPGTGGMTPGIP